ncbi:hypothetical protein [Geothrix campi]|uniref:hypothetical protein n=1 Tax=Geothrix campi TaxID=2966450 RepID=UPI002147F046|nr:hypothetical protein [Geothrix sp. SG10]
MLASLTVQDVINGFTLAGIGLLGIFGLVWCAMPKGKRLKALPNGTRRVTAQELKEAHEQTWKNEQAVDALRRGGAL